MARSPNYPKLSLEEAVERVRKVYQAEHLHQTPKDAVAQHLGYKGINGSSARLITALKHYGLLEEHDKDRVRVTSDAMTILELPRDDPSRIEALRDAAFAPQVFAELQDTYEGRLPSDVTIRHHLLRKKFLPQAADEVIRIYRDNLEFVAEQAPEYDEIVEDDVPEVGSSVQPAQEMQTDVGQATMRAMAEADAMITPATVLQFKISGNSAARIELTGDVTQEAIERLALILDAQKLVFPSEAEMRPSAAEQLAEQTIVKMPESE